MKFHFNEVALRHTAQSRLPDREGRLQYRSSKGGYKERWFRLQGNLLFYFRTNEFGSIADHDPLGVFVLAQFSVELEPIADRPFVFSIAFAGEEGRKHYFSGQTMQQCHDWTDALQRNSYEAVRMKFESLRREVQRLTGKDPLTEKMATSIKQKVKLSVGTLSGAGQESRRTKFYYSDGLSSKSDAPAANSGSKEKAVRPSEALNIKQVRPSDSSSSPRSNVTLSSQEKPLLEEVLVSLGVEDSSVQKNSVQPCVTQMPQVHAKMPLVSQGMLEMPLVQLDNSHMSPPQSGISNLQHEQLGNMSQMPGIYRMPPGQPVISQMPAVQPGISQVPLVRPGISQVPLFQSSISQVPVTQSATAQMLLFHPGITRMPVAQPGFSQMPTAQSGILQMPPVQPGISHVPSAQLGISKMPLMQPDISQHSTTPVQVTQMSTMQMPLTTRPRSAQTAETHNSSSAQKPQISSIDKLVTLQSHTRCISEPNTVNCWPLQPLQRTDKLHTTPELTSFQKWEKFDE